MLEGHAWEIVAGICSLFAIAISLVTICQHLHFYTRPLLQRSIVRILIIVPTYAISSWLSLVKPDAALYFDTVRDCYEAYVIYLFLTLMVWYCGGESMCASRLAEAGGVKHPWPCCCLRPVRGGARFLKNCKRGTLQFVVIKPIMAIASLAMLGVGKYNDTVYQAFLLTIYNICYTVALGALGYFYMGTGPMLTAQRPLYKFLAVKVVILLTYWQGLGVQTLPGLKGEDGERLNNFVLCCEMVFFALFHRHAFSYKVFAALGDSSTDLAETAENWGQQEQPIRANSSSKTRRSSKAKQVLSNAYGVIKVTDVLADIKSTVSNKQAPIERYAGVSLLESESIYGQEMT